MRLLVAARLEALGLGEIEDEARTVVKFEKVGNSWKAVRQTVGDAVGNILKYRSNDR